MTPLAIIPVRIGSKGIPWKNVRPFAGVPLFALAVRVAMKAGIERVCVSTDDPVVAEDAGFQALLRPAALAKDDTPMIDVVRHVAEECSFRGSFWSLWDVAVLLQPTAPLRRPEHIRAALKLLETSGADSVASVVEIPAHYSPDFACGIDGQGGLCLWDGARLGIVKTRRQDCRKAYSRDGTVYVTRREVIEAGSLYGDKCVPLIIPPHESANIDTEEDWQRAERIMRERISVDCPCCLGDGSHEREACSECSGGRMLPHEAEAWKAGK